MRKLIGLLIILSLLCPTYIYAADRKLDGEYKIHLEEGDFVIKNLEVPRKGVGYKGLTGQVLNNTSKNWSWIEFSVYFYDSSGNKIGFFYPSTHHIFDDIFIFGIKKGEERELRESIED